MSIEHSNAYSKLKGKLFIVILASGEKNGASHASDCGSNSKKEVPRRLPAKGRRVYGMRSLTYAAHFAASSILLFAGVACAGIAQSVVNSDDLIVGSIRGLEAWRRDGSGKRMISKGPALHPRWLDADAVLVVHPNNADDLAKGGRIERIVLANGARSCIAHLMNASSLSLDVRISLKSGKVTRNLATGEEICQAAHGRNHG